MKHSTFLIGMGIWVIPGVEIEMVRLTINHSWWFAIPVVIGSIAFWAMLDWYRASAA
jgi:hypothetical protein